MTRFIAPYVYKTREELIRMGFSTEKPADRPTYPEYTHDALSWPEDDCQDMDIDDD